MNWLFAYWELYGTNWLASYMLLLVRKDVSLLAKG